MILLGRSMVQSMKDRRVLICSPPKQEALMSLLHSIFPRKTATSAMTHIHLGTDLHLVYLTPCRLCTR